MLDRKETFRLAIQNEIKSQVLYELMSKSFRNKPESSREFEQLIPLEKMHEEKLKSAFKKEFPNEVFHLPPNQKPVMKASDIDEPKKVLEYAISRENDASDTYKDMAQNSTDNDVISLLLQLAKEEEYHRTILEREILLLQGMMTWYDPSELNGLVED